MKRPFYVVLPLIVVCVFAGCKSSTSIDAPTGPYVTPASAMDPEADEETLRYLLDSSTVHVTLNRAGGKLPKPLQVDDEIYQMVQFGLSKVSADRLNIGEGGTHIPYVWGGKHIDRPTQWSVCGCDPDNNAHCEPRIGLDCSGYVQYVFEGSGLGREEPELNVASLAKTESWDFMRKKGFAVVHFPAPHVSQLVPGDVLIFKDKTGKLVHTGIFLDQEAYLDGSTQPVPAFLNSSGRASCDSNYAIEESLRYTGVVVTPFGNRSQTNLVWAIRFVRDHFSAGTLDYTFTSDWQKHAYAVYDTLSQELEIGGCSDTDGTTAIACAVLFAEKVDGVGKFAIPQRAYNVVNVSQFMYAAPARDYPDSLQLYATTPPTSWLGGVPLPTGGEVEITRFDRGQYYGTFVGKFNFIANSYYSRIEDSTYMIDTIEYTDQVTKYYYQQKEVKGTFSGLFIYR